MLTTVNAAEAARWNGSEGELWVAEHERFDRMLEPLERGLLGAAGLRPGERVLDVGCGAGTTTLAAAWEVGPGGLVTGVDVSAPLVALARSRTGAHPNVELVVRDAQLLDARGAYDAVVSRNGLMLFADPAAAFARLHAALVPGGRIVFTTWAERGANAWWAIPAAAAAAHVPAGDDHDTEARPCAFSLAPEARVREVLTGAGFRDVTLGRTDAELWVGSDVSDVVAFFERHSAALLAQLGGDLARRVVTTLRVSLLPYARADGVWLPSAWWTVRAAA
jgi:SAM-dependent methyltransferase